MPKIISFPDIPDKEFEVGDDFTPTDVEELYNIHRPVQSAGRQALGRFAQGLGGSLAGIPESAAIIANKIGDEFPSIDEGKPLTELDTYKLGKRIRETAEQLAPVDPKREKYFWIDTLPGAAGSMVGFLGAGGLAKKALTIGGTKLTGAAAADAVAGKLASDAIAGRVAVAGVGAASGMAEGYEDAIRRGAPPETAWKSGLINAGLGTTEAASLGRWIDGVNRASGGRLLSAVKEGTIEGAQEVLQQFGGNITASDILKYDPDRKWSKDVLEGGASGGILGSIAGLLIGGRRTGGSTPITPPTQTGTTPTAPTQTDRPLYDEGRPILEASEVDRISTGVEQALSEIPAEEVLATEPEVPVAPELPSGLGAVPPLAPSGQDEKMPTADTGELSDPVVPETPTIVPPEPNLLPLTTQVLKDQLETVPEPVVEPVVEPTAQEPGLPQVVQGNTQQEVAAEEGKKEEVKPSFPLIREASRQQNTIRLAFDTKSGTPPTPEQIESEFSKKGFDVSVTQFNPHEFSKALNEVRYRVDVFDEQGRYSDDKAKSAFESVLGQTENINARGSKSVIDPAIAALESKIKSPSDTTQAVIIPGLDPATARAVWNSALRIAIGVLKATKNVQRAIQAGINFIKHELSKRKLALDDEAEAGLRSEFQSGLTAPGPVRERAKTGTSQSALYQGGEYVLRNEKEDTKLANEFVDNREGDLEQAFQDSKLISEIAFRKVVQAEILARASVEWSKSGKFDPGLVRLMGSIGAEIKAMKSGAGQDLQAEKQVNQKLYPHMPVLSWLDILRQKHAKDIAPDLKGKEPSIIGAADKAGKVAKEAKDKKGRVFVEVLDEDMRQQGVSPEVRKKILKAAARIIRTKPKTPAELWDAMAQEWNMEAMDGPTSQRLKELSQEAQDTPVGSRRNKVLQKMVDTLYDAKGVSAYEFLKDFWYANILSSLRTFGDVLLGSGINGFTMATRGALDAAMVRRSPLQAVRILGQYFGGIAEGASNAIDIIKTGDYSRLPDAEARLMAMLEDPLTMRASALEAFKRAPQTWKKILGQTAYVSRIMTGLDFVGGLGARDSMLVYSVLTRNDTASLEALNKRFEKETNQQAEQQSKTELGPKAKRIDVLARKRELLEQGIDKDIRDNAGDLGRLAALNVQPVGWMQPVVDFVGSWPFIAKTAFGLNFLRASANMLQQAADWMPGVGLVSFGRASITESQWFKDLPKKHPMRLWGLAVSPERRRLIASAQIGGLGITAMAAAAVLGDDDKDKNLDISAGWKGLSPSQRKQLMDSGERPYHIKIGKRWFSYKQTPFAAALAFVGTARDQNRFNKEKWDEQQFGEQLVNAFIGGSLYFKDISALSSFANLVGISASNSEDIDYSDVNRILAQSTASVAGGLIPLASLQRDIDSWLDPQIYKANSGTDYWLRNVPFVRRTIGEGPVINALGEPAIVGREPWSRWTIAENERPLYDMLRNKFHEGVFLPVAGATAQTMDEQTGERRRMTPVETYGYQKKSGQLMKQELEKNLKALDKMTAPEFQKWLEQTQRQISVEARQ